MISPHPDVIDIILQDVPEGSTVQLSVYLINGNAASGYLHATDPGVITLAHHAEDSTPKEHIYVSRGAIVTATVLSY